MRPIILSALLAAALLFMPGKATACPPGSFVIDQFGNPQFVPAVSTFSSGFVGSPFLSGGVGVSVGGSSVFIGNGFVPGFSGFNSLGGFGLGGFSRFGAIGGRGLGARALGGRGLGARGLGGRALGGRAIGGRRR
jgi:hypothetical protein